MYSLADTFKKLVQSTMTNFHIDTDKIAIGRINESLATLQQARDLRIREAETALKSTYKLAVHLMLCQSNKWCRVLSQPFDNVAAA